MDCTLEANAKCGSQYKLSVYQADTYNCDGSGDTEGFVIYNGVECWSDDRCTCFMKK